MDEERDEPKVEVADQTVASDQPTVATPDRSRHLPDADLPCPRLSDLWIEAGVRTRLMRRRTSK